MSPEFSYTLRFPGFGHNSWVYTKSLSQKMNVWSAKIVLVNFIFLESIELTQVKWGTVVHTQFLPFPIKINSRVSYIQNELK